MLDIDIRQKSWPAAGAVPATVALRDVRFSVRPDELVCIIGPSGCGKTTLLNIVAGLDREYDGRIGYSGPAGRATPVVGYVFQKPRLLAWRTVLENVTLAMARDRRQSGLAEELLAAAGLGDFLHAYPERLSVGMARRAALARAFAVEPDLLLMDEPFVSLDEATADRLRELLQAILGRRPTTVLFVTHDVREAIGLADRIVRLSAAPGTIVDVLSIAMPRGRRSDPAFVDELRRRLI